MASGRKSMWYAEVQIALDEQLKIREREVQLLVNIVCPDIRYQPWYLSDHTDLFAVREQGGEIIRPRLEGYFGVPLKFELPHGQPVWKLIDEIKRLYPDWPDAWE